MEISKEVLKRRWDWLGHILRRDKDDHCQVAITLAPEGKRKIGWPKVNWRRTAETERNSMGWSSWNQARQVAKDPVEWQCCTEALCAQRARRRKVKVKVTKNNIKLKTIQENCSNIRSNWSCAFISIAFSMDALFVRVLRHFKHTNSGIYISCLR